MCLLTNERRSKNCHLKEGGVLSCKLLVFSLVQHDKNETRWAQNLGRTCTWKSLINLHKSRQLPTLTSVAHWGRRNRWVGLVGWLVIWLLEQFVNLSFSLVIFFGITYTIIVSSSCEEWGPGGRMGGLNVPSQRHSFSTFSYIWTSCWWENGRGEGGDGRGLLEAMACCPWVSCSQ